MTHATYELMKAFPNVWCPDCGKVQPMKIAIMKANDRNNHDAADIPVQRMQTCGHHPACGACNAICLGGAPQTENRPARTGRQGYFSQMAPSGFGGPQLPTRCRPFGSRGRNGRSTPRRRASGRLNPVHLGRHVAPPGVLRLRQPWPVPRPPGPLIVFQSSELYPRAKGRQGGEHLDAKRRLPEARNQQGA